MIWIRLASIFGVLGVALGAFGAHGLKAYLSPAEVSIYQTAVFYHITHTLALLGFGLLRRQENLQKQWPGACFATGIILFSGSLYALAITGISWLGAITPVGGTLLLAGWMGLGLGIKKKI